MRLCPEPTLAPSSLPRGPPAASVPRQALTPVPSQVRPKPTQLKNQRPSPSHRALVPLTWDWPQQHGCFLVPETTVRSALVPALFDQHTHPSPALMRCCPHVRAESHKTMSLPLRALPGQLRVIRRPFDECVAERRGLRGPQRRSSQEQAKEPSARR